MSDEELQELEAMLEDLIPAVPLMSVEGQLLARLRERVIRDGTDAFVPERTWERLREIWGVIES